MSCYKYWGKIEEIANALTDIGEDNINDVDMEDIIGLLDEVELIAHDKEIDFDSAKHILDDEKMNKALQLIRKFYVYIGARLEKENALDILKSDDPWDTLNSFHFFERYEGLLENESKLARFDESKTFVFIGSGPLPLTPIMFNKLFACKCVGIEIQEDVAELSRKVLKKLGLDEDIKIIVGDETSLKDIDYDIVMVAAFAVPKDKIFSNIWEIVNTKTPILYRTYSGMRAILYAPITERDTRGFHKEVMLLPKGNVNNTSVLIRKIV